MMWWPGMDGDIEETVKKCQHCQLTRHNPAPTPCQSWDSLETPSHRLCRPFLRKWYLLVIDAHSKWLEIEINSANTSTSIERLRQIFATHGLPSTAVSDNGSGSRVKSSPPL